VTSLLTNALLRDLIAAGEVDILVGLPTYNHHHTVAPVVAAVVAAFAGPFVRERSVLLNVDGGSSDGTPELIRTAAPVAELVSTQYALRTIHRITAPYHGLAGRGTALRILLTAAELLRARAVVVLDPAASQLETADVVAFVRAALEADYVKPALPRAPGDGPLVTQLVRPLFRAALGLRLLEPIDTQFGCSARFLTSVLTTDVWGDPHAETGIDAFLSVHAAANDFTIAQLATAARARVDDQRRPSAAEVFRQVVGSLIASLARSFLAWKQIKTSRELPVSGALPSAGSPPRFDVEALADTFRHGTQALSPLLGRVLGPELSEPLVALTREPELRFGDELWARTVFGCVEASVTERATNDDLPRLLEPIYLGRVASFLEQLPASGTIDASEALAVAFEQAKLALVARAPALGER
jgi:hypothetical protein